MLDRRRGLRLRPARGVALGAALALAVGARAVGATLRLGPVQVAGNVQSQNLVRHADATSYGFIQNRNTMHLTLDYDWLQGGRFMERIDLPFVERSRLRLLWRGVYDSVYDTTPGFITKEDIHGRAYGGRTLFEAARARGFPRDVLTLSGLSRDARDTLRFENELREAYVDLKLRGLPLTLRAGRQQVVWGETDNFRLLDRVNPLDLTWHLQQEIPAPALGWDELRRPLWMLKFLYDLGDVWRLSQSFLEWYWNPGDWYPAKQAFLPRPWGLPFLDPLRNPVDGAFIGGVCGASPFKIRSGPNRDLGYCTTLIDNTRLFVQGDYQRNALENSQVGVRYHAITPQGVELSVAYLHQRWAGDDGSNSAPLKGVLRTFDPRTDQTLTDQFLRRGIFPAKFIAPYVHTVGLSATYAEERYTQTVLRLETLYDVGIPFFDVAKVTLIDTPALPGVSEKDMWKGMLAFDRPTWIRSLNRTSTFFLTGQLFWHYLIDNPGCAAQDVASLPAKQRARAGSCLVGGLDLPSRERPPNEAFRDKVRTWEALATFAASAFYRGGSVVPTLGFAVDPVNQWNLEAFWAVDWIVRDWLVVNLAQRYFVTPRGHSPPIFETWGLGGLNAGRSETGLRVTLQF